MGAFDKAWSVFKQRGFEVDPRYEDERLQRLEQGYDEKDRLVDNLQDVQSKLMNRTRGSSGGSLSLLAERDNLENELYQLMRNPEGARYGDPPMNMIEAQTGPMFQEQQSRAAEEIEAEGIDLPDGPRVSAVPPASVGRAGSVMGEGRPNLKELYFGSNNQAPAARNEFITADDFMRDPNEVALRQQTMANEQTPLGQALAQARSQSPQPLQFEKAWAVLKSRTNRDYPFTPSGRAGEQTQYSPNFTGNTIPLVGEGVDRTPTDTSRLGGKPMKSGERRAKEKVGMRQMMRNESAPNLEEEE
tara:strand:+ start:1214 stop:2119 length:906 start_codon:yes stop_codon:yes gene_type:complete